MSKTAARERTRRYRERLAAQGLRPIQLWVPDTTSPTFTDEARRQSRLLADDPATREATAAIESIADEVFA